MLHIYLSVVAIYKTNICVYILYKHKSHVCVPLRLAADVLQLLVGGEEPQLHHPRGDPLQAPRPEAVFFDVGCLHRVARA